MKKILFIGQIDAGENVVRGETERFCHGPALIGAITARRLGVPAAMLSKCAETHRAGFGYLDDLGIEARFLPSPKTTSFRNIYPTENPDDRKSYAIALADPYNEADLAHIAEFQADVIHLTPLRYGEVPFELLPRVRSQTPFLSLDAAAILRAPQPPDGRLQARTVPDAEKHEVFSCLDLIKVDFEEAFCLTGEKEPRRAVEAVYAFGPKIVLYTYRAGVCAFDGRQFCESPFGPYTLDGRTGRGDTCTASFNCALIQGMNLEEATRFSAEITTRKMQYRGPYRG